MNTIPHIFTKRLNYVYTLGLATRFFHAYMTYAFLEGLNDKIFLEKLTLSFS